MNRKVTAALLSALVCPGAGQWYNRERKKAGALFLATGLLAAGLVWVVLQGLWRIAVDGTTPLDPSQSFVLAQAVLESERGPLLVVHVLLAVLWTYATVDAFLRAGARDQP